LRHPPDPTVGGRSPVSLCRHRHHRHGDLLLPPETRQALTAPTAELQVTGLTGWIDRKRTEDLKLSPSGKLSLLGQANVRQNPDLPKTPPCPGLPPGNVAKY
ncbi:hypothetical protein chiPu_0027359, partial [Chiloscyllium punctatum]|nr:hypothetical protein [Chiloscyllium punctatum]